MHKAIYFLLQSLLTGYATVVNNAECHESR